MLFGEGMAYRRALFVDVTIISSIGVNLLPVKKFKARRFKLWDLRILKYITHGSTSFSPNLHFMTKFYFYRTE